MMRITVPGRTELGGNHTDHQGGRVLAAAVDLYLRAQAEAENGGLVHLQSDGFGEIIVDTAALSPADSLPGSPAALVRGVLEFLRDRGWRVGGLGARVRSDIPAGAGLSSSAAFGVLAGRLVSRLYNGDEIPPAELAEAAQYAENRHFGKPCGRMDQCACAYGGVSFMDFRDPAAPKVETVGDRFFEPDYLLVMVNTGGSHADLTADYAAIPRDMGAAAAFLGKTRLRDVAEGDFLSALPELRRACGDRAAARALHFFGEDRRAARMADALKVRDVGAYLRLMDASGRSSEALLQNTWSPVAPDAQAIPLALGLCRRALGENGAARVHGGGFAGSIQVLLPADALPALQSTLEPVFGEGCCRTLKVGTRDQMNNE